jgi:hypothetical protein
MRLLVPLPQVANSYHYQSHQLAFLLMVRNNVLDYLGLDTVKTENTASKNADTNY